jgi:DNA gyrase/topoisomerase IV subunit B
LRKLQVGRIIYLSDADPDGYHINSLLNALTAELMPGAYDLGLIYVADMPEFYTIAKGQLFVGSTLSEVQDKLVKAKVKAEVSHAKGWGEVDAEVLRVLVASPARRLIKINPLTPEDLQTFKSFMGNDEPSAVDEDDEDKPKRKSRVLKSSEVKRDKKDVDSKDFPKKADVESDPKVKAKRKKAKKGKEKTK